LYQFKFVKFEGQLL